MLLAMGLMRAAVMVWATGKIAVVMAVDEAPVMMLAVI